MENYEYENDNVIYENEEIAVVEKGKTTGKRRFIPFWIIVAILFIATTAFMIYAFADAKASDAVNEIKLGGLGAALLLIIYGSIGYAATILSSLIGLILTCACRPSTGLRKGQLAYFIIFVILPIFMWVIFWLMLSIVF